MLCSRNILNVVCCSTFGVIWKFSNEHGELNFLHPYFVFEGFECSFQKRMPKMLACYNGPDDIL